MPPPLNHRSPTPGTPIVQASPFRWRENHRKAGAKTRGKQWDSNAYHSTGETRQGLLEWLWHLAPINSTLNNMQVIHEILWSQNANVCENPGKNSLLGKPVMFLFVCVFWVPFWRCLNKTWDGNRKPFQLWLGKRGSQAENNWILLGFYSSLISGVKWAPPLITGYKGPHLAPVFAWFFHVFGGFLMHPPKPSNVSKDFLRIEECGRKNLHGESRKKNWATKKGSRPYFPLYILVV